MYLKRAKKLLTLCIALSTISVSAATPEELAKACDLALTAKKEEASLCGLGVQLRQNELERVTKENADLRSAGTAWYNNGFIWGAVGVILGAYAGARAVR